MKPNQTKISTLLSESTGGIGDSVHDTSSLSGATSNAGGTVSYAVYTNTTCATLAALGYGRGGQRSGGAVTAGSPANSSAVTFSKAGSFWWQATYSGDTNNTGPVKSVCSSEPLTINPDRKSVV